MRLFKPEHGRISVTRQVEWGIGVIRAVRLRLLTACGLIPDGGKLAWPIRREEDGGRGERSV